MTKFDESAFDANAPKVQTTITDSEIEAILSIPAVFAGKFYLANQDGNLIRLTFVDESPDKKHFVPRASIVMTIAGFMSLSQMLYNTANNIQSQINQENHFRKMAIENSKPKVEREELK